MRVNGSELLFQAFLWPVATALAALLGFLVWRLSMDYMQGATGALIEHLPGASITLAGPITLLITSVMSFASGLILGALSSRTGLAPLPLAPFVLGAASPLLECVLLSRRLAADEARDPSSHNLWPFEYAMRLVLIAVPFTIGALIGVNWARK